MPRKPSLEVIAIKRPVRKTEHRSFQRLLNGSHKLFAVMYPRQLLCFLSGDSGIALQEFHKTCHSEVQTN